MKPIDPKFLSKDDDGNLFVTSCIDIILDDEYSVKIEFPKQLFEHPSREQICDKMLDTMIARAKSYQFCVIDKSLINKIDSELRSILLKTLQENGMDYKKYEYHKQKVENYIDLSEPVAAIT